MEDNYLIVLFASKTPANIRLVGEAPTKQMAELAAANPVKVSITVDKAGEEMDEDAISYDRFRMDPMNPLRRNILSRYLHRFRNIFLKGVELQFQSNYWQQLGVRPRRHTISQTVSSDGRFLALTISDASQPNSLRLEIWTLWNAQLISESTVHNELVNPIDPDAFMFWGQYFSSHSLHLAAPEIAATGVTSQRWDGLSMWGHFMVLSRRRKIGRKWPSHSSSIFEDYGGNDLGVSVSSEDGDPESAEIDFEPLNDPDEQQTNAEVPGLSFFFSPDDTDEASHDSSSLFDDDTEASPSLAEELELELEELPPNLRKLGVIRCSICNAAILTDGLHCTECGDGGFDICKDCFERGLWCNNTDHRLPEGTYCQSQSQPQPGLTFDAPEIEEELRIVDTQNARGTIFHYQERFRAAHLDSVQVIHPGTHTVAWYLAQNIILFHNVKDESVSMFSPGGLPTNAFAGRLHYSTTGDFLHVLTLACSTKTTEQDGANLLVDFSPIESNRASALKVLVCCATYHISSSTSIPFTSDPLSYSRFEVNVGSCKAISKIPFELTWTSEEAYLSINDHHLKLYKINLFAEEGSITHRSKTSMSADRVEAAQYTDVRKPRHPIILPDSAHSKAVCYFPQDDSTGDALLLVTTSEAHQPCLPFGVLVDKHVIGDWLPLDYGKDMRSAANLGNFSLLLDGPEDRKVSFGDITIPLRLITDENDEKIFTSSDGIIKLTETPKKYDVSFHWDGERGMQSTVAFTSRSQFSGPYAGAGVNVIPTSRVGGSDYKQRYPIRMTTFAPFSWLGHSGQYWRPSEENSSAEIPQDSTQDFGLCSSCLKLRLSPTDFICEDAEEERSDFIVSEEADHASQSTHAVTCDVCQKKLWSPCVTYRCGICKDGQFDVCEDCKCIGSHCWDKSHKLKKMRELPQYYDRIIENIGESKMPSWTGSLGTLRSLIQRGSFCPLCRLFEASINRSRLSVGVRGLEGVNRVRGIPYEEYVDMIKVVVKWVEFGWNPTRRQIQGRYLQAQSQDNDIGYPIVLLSESAPFAGLTGHRIDSRQIYFPMVKAWLNDCEHNHGPDCDGSTYAVHHRVRHFRVIDVQEMCIVETQITTRFAALSYVWGGPQKLQAESKNISFLETKGSLKKVYDDIPRTIQDAILFMSSLGERYLWVDALCIVQDDQRIISHLVGIMDIIYSRAAFTIIAAAGSSVNEPLPGVRPWSRAVEQTTTEVGPEIKLLVLPELETQLKKTTYYTRGWTFQEQLLSRRRFIFTDKMMYMQCERRIYREDFCPDKPDAISSLLQSSDRHTSLSAYVGLRPGRVFGRGGNCERVVQDYLSRSLTDDSDIFKAFNGVLNVLESRLGVEFLAGLSKSNLDSSILWATKRNAKRRKGFPSFSWLGWVGKALWPEQDTVSHPFLHMAITDEEKWYCNDTYIEWYQRGSGRKLKPVRSRGKLAYSWVSRMYKQTKRRDGEEGTVDLDIMGRPVDYDWKRDKGKKAAERNDDAGANQTEKEDSEDQIAVWIRDTLPPKPTAAPLDTLSDTLMPATGDFLSFVAVVVEVYLSDAKTAMQSNTNFKFLSLMDDTGTTVGLVTVSEEFKYRNGCKASAIVLSSMSNSAGIARTVTESSREGDSMTIIGDEEYEDHILSMVTCAFNVMLIEPEGRFSVRVGAGCMVQSALGRLESKWQHVVLI